MNSRTATILSAYLKDKEIDIILAGNVTVDGSSGQVGPRLAEELRNICGDNNYEACG